jgi:hypothetical protein
MNDPAAQKRKAQLYLQHPEGSPDELIGTPDYLMHPPSKLSSTASWEAFRDKTLLPMIEHRPDDPNLPNYLKQVEEVLAWRATISPADRFWKANPEPNDAAAAPREGDERDRI